MAENMDSQNLSEGHAVATFDAAAAFLTNHSTLPPPAALKSIGAEDLAKMVDSAPFAPFLPSLWPAAFGAPPPFRPRRHQKRHAPCHTMTRAPPVHPVITHCIDLFWLAHMLVEQSFTPPEQPLLMTLRVDEAEKSKQAVAPAGIEHQA